MVLDIMERKMNINRKMFRAELYSDNLELLRDIVTEIDRLIEEYYPEK